jgi:hypothetical protein
MHGAQKIDEFLKQNQSVWFPNREPPCARELHFVKITCQVTPSNPESFKGNEFRGGKKKNSFS